MRMNSGTDGKRRGPGRFCYAWWVLAFGLGGGPGVAAAGSDLEVNYMAVGSGNCVVVNCPGSEKHVVLDCGTQYSAERNVNVADSVWKMLTEDAENGEFDGKIDFIVSHTDKDHYNIIPNLISGRYVDGTPIEPRNVYVGGDFSQLTQGKTGNLFREKASAIYGSWKSVGQGKTEETILTGFKRKDPGGTTNKKTLGAVTGESFSGRVWPYGMCGDATLTILSGNAKPDRLAARKNEQSLVVALEYAGRSFIFPGDATNGSEKALDTALLQWEQLKGEDNTRVDVMMVPHHGSATHGSNDSRWPGQLEGKGIAVFSGEPSGTYLKVAKNGTPSLAWTQETHRNPRLEGYTPYQGQLRPLPVKDGIWFHYFDPAENDQEPTRERVSDAALELTTTGDLRVTVDESGDMVVECEYESFCSPPSRWSIGD